MYYRTLQADDGREYSPTELSAAKTHKQEDHCGNKQVTNCQFAKRSRTHLHTVDQDLLWVHRGTAHDASNQRDGSNRTESHLPPHVLALPFASFEAMSLTNEDGWLHMQVVGTGGGPLARGTRQSKQGACLAVAIMIDTHFVDASSLCCNNGEESQPEHCTWIPHLPDQLLICFSSLSSKRERTSHFLKRFK